MFAVAVWKLEQAMRIGGSFIGHTGRAGKIFIYMRLYPAEKVKVKLRLTGKIGVIIMDNCTYNKVKLLHELSKLAGFIQKFGRKDAKSARHGECHKLLNHLHKDLHTHMEQLRKQIGKRKLK